MYIVKHAKAQEYERLLADTYSTVTGELRMSSAVQ